MLEAVKAGRASENIPPTQHSEPKGLHNRIPSAPKDHRRARLSKKIKTNTFLSFTFTQNKKRSRSSAVFFEK
jgi:hypothetical protein